MWCARGISAPFQPRRALHYKNDSDSYSNLSEWNGQIPMQDRSFRNGLVKSLTRLEDRQVCRRTMGFGVQWQTAGIPCGLIGLLFRPDRYNLDVQVPDGLSRQKKLYQHRLRRINWAMRRISSSPSTASGRGVAAIRIASKDSSCSGTRDNCRTCALAELSPRCQIRPELIVTYEQYPTSAH